MSKMLEMSDRTFAFSAQEMYGTSQYRQKLEHIWCTSTVQFWFVYIVLIRLLSFSGWQNWNRNRVQYCPIYVFQYLLGLQVFFPIFSFLVLFKVICILVNVPCMVQLHRVQKKKKKSKEAPNLWYCAATADFHQNCFIDFEMSVS